MTAFVFAQVVPFASNEFRKLLLSKRQIFSDISNVFGNHAKILYERIRACQALCIWIINKQFKFVR